MAVLCAFVDGGGMSLHSRKLSYGFLLVLMGNLLRLCAGMVVFIVLARWLGPQDFGTFTLWLAVATMAVIPVNFGFTTAALRAFGAEPERKLAVMSEVLTAKLLLATLVVLAAALYWVVNPAAAAWVFFPLLLAQICESLSELYGLGFRAASNYAAEARTASLVSLLHIAVMLLAPWMFHSVLAISWAFLGSRFAGMLITRRQAHAAFHALAPASIGTSLRFARGSFAYAVELGLSTAYTQLDALIINAALGLRAVGLYQAGMKLVQGFSRLAPILALYILPRLAGDINAGQRSIQQIRATLLLFGAVGLLSGGSMALFAEPITALLFGPQFAELILMLPLFGCLLALRFLETGCGLVLVAAGLQSRKVWLVAVQLALMLGAGWMAIRQGGLAAWLLTSIACTVLLLVMYLLLWIRARSAVAKTD